jgi:hypothetical protein
VRYIPWGFFQMPALLLAFPRECHSQHAQSFHVLSLLLKLKLYFIAYFDTFFRYNFAFFVILFDMEVHFSHAEAISEVFFPHKTHPSFCVLSEFFCWGVAGSRGVHKNIVMLGLRERKF